MSTLAKLVGAPRADIIEGYILSRPRLMEIALAEEEFTRRYMALISASIADVPSSAAAVVMTSAKEDILRGEFSYGGSIFNIWAMAPGNRSFLTYLCLRVKHGEKVTRQSVADMYEKGDPDAIGQATLELWGYLDRPKNDGGPAIPDQSTGPQSSDFSTSTSTTAPA